MPLSLTTITVPPSNLLTEFVPFHAENGMSLNDLRTFINHINSLPNCELKFAISAKSMYSMASVDEKYLHDNKATDKILNLYVKGGVVLTTPDMGTVNSLNTVIVKELEGNAANIVANYIIAKPPFSHIEQFLYFCGFTKQEMANWFIGWPEVQALVKNKLASL